MASKIVEVSQRAARLRIETDKGIRYMDGTVNTYQADSPEQLFAAIKEKSEPYLDYFVFSGAAPDVSPSGCSIVEVFVSEANRFNLKKGKKAAFSLFDLNVVGATAETPNTAFVGWVDNRWEDEIKKIEVEVVKRAGQKPTALDERMTGAFKKRLSEKLNGRALDVKDIKAVVHEVEKELREISWGVGEIRPEIIDDPDGAKGEKAVRVTVKIFSPAYGISLDGLPEHIRRQALEKLNSGMEDVFKHHPAVISSGISSESPFPPKLEFRTDKNTFMWVYPPDVPALFNDPVFGGLSGLITGKENDSVPSPIPLEAMPIPSDVFNDFIAWLTGALEKESGVYDVKADVAEGGVAKISVSRRDSVQFAISNLAIREIKEELGVDLSGEAILLKTGTKNWSAQRTREFIKNLRGKFRSAGRELLTDSETFLHARPDGIVEILPFNIPLIKPSQIIFEGDVDLAGIGGVKKLEDALGGKPMTRAELGERLNAVEDMYHKAGYLIEGESLLMNVGLQLKMIGNEDGSIRVIIRVARTGSIEVSGDVNDRSKKAFAEALHMKEGDPLRVEELLHRMKRAMIRLHLMSEGEPKFIIRRDQKMNIVFNVKRERGVRHLALSYSGPTVALMGGERQNHAIAGTSQTSADASIGTYLLKDSSSYGEPVVGLSLSAEFLPINASGQRFATRGSFGNTPYVHGITPDGYDEIGVMQKYFGSVTYLIPLGNAGIASPVELRIGVRETAIHRKGERADGLGVEETNYYSGGTVGVGTLYDSVIFKEDVFSTDTSVGIDHGHTNNRGDITLGEDIRYSMPLGEYFALEASASAAKRMAAYGGDLPPERRFGVGDVPLVDFGRKFGELYEGSYRWYGGFLVVLSANELIQPFVGVSVSGDPSDTARAGAGLGLRMPFLGGLAIYFGVSDEGASTGGLGMSGRWEIQ